MAQLLQILYNLKVTSNVTAFVKSDLPQLPIIMAMTEVLVTFPRLAENIDRCILSEDEIAENVPNFSIMTNSVANNGNPFGSADYAKNRNKILNTGIDIWEYEGGYSYHGKSILIDDDISVIGSFNMDMRSTYLDTELMLVIRSKEINKQLEEGMMEYEKVSRQALEDGTYHDPYHVKPIELTKKRQRNVVLVQHLLGWARYLF